jgi:hypothetical protein
MRLDRGVACFGEHLESIDCRPLMKQFHSSGLPTPRDVRWDNPAIEKVIEARMRSPHVFTGDDQLGRSVLDKLLPSG